MRECEQSVLEQYDIEVKHVRRIREAFLCETESGPFLIKEMKFPEKRIEKIYELGKWLGEHDFLNTDQIVKTKEDTFFAAGEDGTRYFLKKWFYGKECDVQRETELLAAARKLAELHLVMTGYDQSEEAESLFKQEPLGQEMERHNRELKKVRQFVRKRVDKGPFEYLFLQHFDRMYEWAAEAEEQLNRSSYQDLWEKSREEGCLIHGDYNYHNILFLHGNAAVTNFDHFCGGVQVADFYYFLRKTMEKHHWNIALGEKIIEEYHKIRPLQLSELEYIRIRLLYPEKFWKAANSYYQSRKAWIPEKNMEKLTLVVQETTEKRHFLESLLDLCLP